MSENNESENESEDAQESTTEELVDEGLEQSIEETDAVVHDEDGNPRFRTEQLTKSMKPSEDSDESEDE